jgi:translocator protein
MPCPAKKGANILQTRVQMSGESALRLAASIALCFAVAYAGARITYPEIPTWYAGLSKPAWTPPNWAFPVVWNVLFLLMAVSLWLLWDRSAPSKPRSIAIGLFLGQLALNAAWSPVFFALHLTQAALLIIIALAVLLAATICHALAVNRAAAWLLVPYLLWILYASTLNAGIVTLNP